MSTIDRSAARYGRDVATRRRLLMGAAALVAAAGCSSDDSSNDVTPPDTVAVTAAPVTTEVSEAAVSVDPGLFDCGPFTTKLGREMTYFVRLDVDATMTDVMSSNDAAVVSAALDERRSDDLSTDIGIGDYTITGDRFDATTTDTLGYRIVYEGTVVSSTALRLRTTSSLYDFDTERTCTRVDLG
jgi:hypothetical protein